MFYFVDYLDLPQVCKRLKRSVLKKLRPYPANIFLSSKCGLFIISAAYMQVHFKLDFIMKANTINHDQTAPFSSLICVHIVCNLGYLNS